MPPARGCDECRAARLKCGGGEPCPRCLRLGRRCAGFRRSDELVIQDETEKAALRSQRPRRRSPRTPPRADSTPPHSPQDPAPTRPTELGKLPWLRETLPRNLQPKAEDVAVSRFFANYVLLPRYHGGDDGHLADMPMLYSKCEEFSILRLAVDSCSLASFANVAHAEVFRVAARVKYGQALQALQIATSDAELAKRDETLMAVLVLEYHSLVAEDSPNLLGPHAQAIAPILRLRGIHQLQTSVGWNIFRVAYMRLQFLKLLSREEPMVESFTWMNELSADHLEVQIYANALRISQACAELRDLLQRAHAEGLHPDLAQALQTIMQQLREGDAYTDHWLDTAPMRWRPQHCAHAPSDYTATERPFYYHDVWIAITHYYHRSFRIQLHEVMVQALELLHTRGTTLDLGGDTTSAIEHSMRKGRAFIDGNILSVPFLTGQIDSYGLSTQDGGHGQRMELGMFHACVALKPIAESPLATEAQKERARELTGEVEGMARRGGGVV